MKLYPGQKISCRPIFKLANDFCGVTNWQSIFGLNNELTCDFLLRITQKGIRANKAESYVGALYRTLELF